MDARRIGILYPSNGIYDAEFSRFAPEGVSVHLTRWRWPDADWSRPEAPDMMAALAHDPQIAASAALFDQIDPAVVTLGCTSVSFAAGADGDAAVLQTIGRGTKARPSSTSTGFAAACHALGARRVAIASVYRESLTQRFIDFLGSRGIEVVSHFSDNWAHDPTRMTGEDLLALSKAGDSAAAQAILMPETNIVTSDAIPFLEERLGKPVLTAIQVTVWHAARLAGISPSDGIGAVWRA